MNTTRAGFTIVELLIVVVVIAILAAITIVSYNGITEQARNSQLLGKVDSYAKALQLYKVKNGAYPLVSVTESGLANYACLGSAASFPADSTYSSASCYKAGATVVKTSSTLESELKTIVSNLPDAALPSVLSSDSSMAIRGLLYSTSGSGASSMQYIVKGDQDCARGVKSYNVSSWPGMTVCTITLG
jgi:prepilin-type N-terminal cleavage/methylation domain-containing protein